MEETTITFLGTASAIPTAKRNHVGILLSWGAENILFDCGEGIQRQFRIAKINPCKLTKIIITHWHADHTLGIPGLLETLAMSEYPKKLQIYGPRGTKNKIELLEKIYGKFRLNYEVKEISGKFLDEKNFSVEASKMTHGPETNAYAFTIKDKLRINKQKLKKLKIPNSPELAKLAEGKDIVHPETKKKIKANSLTYLEKGKKITIILDTSENSQASKLAKNSDLLICEASFLSSEKAKAKEYKHLTAGQAAKIAKLSKSKKLALTHNSQRYEKSSKSILDEAKKVFKNTVFPNDFDTLKI